MKKSIKLMAKEEKEKRPGATRKLDVPLARRQQDKLLRTAAYEQTNQTLGRWTDTVKHNRRAEHLTFPLPQNLPGAGLDNGEIRPLTSKNASNELEQTIMSIMEQSGLATNPNESTQKNGDTEDGPSEAGLKAMWNERRRERELNSRETKRAKRIKKIKSKAYHRVHRRGREKEEIAMHEAMKEAGEIDSDAEREAQDRKRALERVGARHRDSKWAKLAGKNKRAVWDDDFREGLHQMSRMDDELRKRKEGRDGGSDSDAESNSGSDATSGSEADERRLLKDLDRAARSEDGPPESKLMSLKFMQRSEEALKKANDAMAEDLRRIIEGRGEEEASDEEAEIGRRSYGISKTAALANRTTEETSADDGPGEVAATSVSTSKPDSRTGRPDLSANTEAEAPITNKWGKRESRRKSKRDTSSRAVLEPEDLDTSLLPAAQVEKPQRTTIKKRDGTRSEPQQRGLRTLDNSDGEDSGDNPEAHLPPTPSHQELIARAFAGNDSVSAEFEREKAQAAEEDDDKVIDNTLPGWGGWVGEGISKRELSRQKGRFLTKVEGVKKKDRKDAKLEKVIVSEKRIKKVRRDSLIQFSPTLPDNSR